MQLATPTAAGTHSLTIPAADWGRWLLRVSSSDDNGTPSGTATASDYVIVGTPVAPASVAVTGGANGALRVTIR